MQVYPRVYSQPATNENTCSQVAMSLICSALITTILMTLIVLLVNREEINSSSSG